MNRKTVLLYTSPARGHLYPMMDVALALKEEGYHVIVQTLADEQNNVEGQGLHHAAIAEAIEAKVLEDYRESNPIAQLKTTFDCWLTRAKHEIEDLRVTVSTYELDLLIVDANTWGAAAYAESLREPWVMFMPYCLPISSPDTPAFGLGFAPPDHLLHRLRDRIVNRFTNRALKPYIDGLNRLRAELSVPQLDRYEQIFDRPDRVLYRTAEPFDYPRENWPDHIIAVGPGLWAPAHEKPEWLDALPSPRILVTVSTERQNDGAIIETAIQALSNQSGSLIITSAALDPADFTNAHSNVHIHKFLPHAEIIPEMDLVITHGGMGTTQRALAAGVPVCVIPWGRDQRETARRVEVSGSGTMLPKSRLNAKHLHAAAIEAMSRKEGAANIARAFAQAGGAQRAVEEINRLMGSLKTVAG
jgi:MGT family glycosyltransferase